MDVALILQNVGKHIQLSKTEADYFVSLLQRRTLKRKEYLLKEGDVCKTENFVTKGCLRTYTIDENGFEHTLMFAIERQKNVQCSIFNAQCSAYTGAMLSFIEIVLPLLSLVLF